MSLNTNPDSPRQKMINLMYCPDGDAGTQRFVGCAEWFFIGR